MIGARATSATPGSDIVSDQCRVARDDEDEIDEDQDCGTVNTEDLVTECQPVHDDDAEAARRR